MTPKANTAEELAKELVLLDRKAGLCILIQRKEDHKFVVRRLALMSKGKGYAAKADAWHICNLGVGWKVEGGCVCPDCIETMTARLTERIQKGLDRARKEESQCQEKKSQENTTCGT